MIGRFLAAGIFLFLKLLESPCAQKRCGDVVWENFVFSDGRCSLEPASSQRKLVKQCSTILHFWGKLQRRVFSNTLLRPCEAVLAGFSSFGMPLWNSFGSFDFGMSIAAGSLSFEMKHTSFRRRQILPTWRIRWVVTYSRLWESVRLERMWWCGFEKTVFFEMVDVYYSQHLCVWKLRHNVLPSDFFVAKCSEKLVLLLLKLCETALSFERPLQPKVFGLNRCTIFARHSASNWTDIMGCDLRKAARTGVVTWFKKLWLIAINRCSSSWLPKR